MTPRLDGHDVVLTHRERVLFPKAGITKGDLVAYYAGIAPVMMPELRGRPLMLQRFPGGIASAGFFQQEASGYFPPWVRRASVETESGRQERVVCDNAATLAYLANQGCITFHRWLSRTDRIHHPDRLVFDLDPAGNDFAAACAAARAFRILLEELGLPPFVMTTGSRGLHVVVPLSGSDDFDAARQLARDIGEWAASRQPGVLTTEQRIRKRGRRLFLDALRNAYAHTAVAPYSVRAKEGAPVATPVEWDELEGCTLGSRHYTIHNIFRRLESRGDPWKVIENKAVSLPRARRRLARLSTRRTVPAGR